ncbi:MAG: dUTP diphosphatase [Alphaproteobacteria bacterium]|nr:dUTP diphosphatase [Alphaproteobacteria bacterium]
MSNKTNISIKRFPHGELFPLPEYASQNSAGMDLIAAIPTEIELPAGGREVVPTGVAIGLTVGLEAQVRPRSGLAARCGITVLNSPGTIDADYRGEIKVILYNASSETFIIEKGMRIAQLIVAPVVHVEWNEVPELNKTARGAGGFGSTGVKV